MDAARWARMQALFYDALDLPASERLTFLEAACGDDPSLVSDVLTLLEEDAREASLLDQDLARTAHTILSGAVLLPQRIGPYRIRKLLGEGGMGVVYLAEREDLQSLAAIKFLRDASLSQDRRARFAREEQTLAQLNNPSIARLYDANVLPDGTPYFIMEYVEGVPLTTFCTTNKHSIPERLRLFRAVCEAVQYAHRQAVIHRDLKPSNILVTGEGQIKLLDFGIAKKLDELDEPAHQTYTGLRFMTPAYAAPEQIQGEPVGVYTDVYTLGVILYELLTDRLPFDVSGRTPGQIETLILEQEPEKPSVLAGQAADVSLRCSFDKRAWKDLDVLCLTAMHKDPQRRYPTVEALIRDLENFLHEKPLEARPDTLAYRTGKFLRRNRNSVTGAVLVTTLIAALILFYTVQLTTARDAAIAEAARTQRIQQFMLGLFEGDSDTGPSDTLRVRTLIDRGIREARVLDGEPAIQAELYQTLSGIYQKLGQLDRADSLLRMAFDQRRALYGLDHPDVAASQVAMGLLRLDQSALDEAERLTREGLETIRRHLPPEHPSVSRALTALGQVLQGRGDYPGAIEVLEEAIRLQTARGARSPQLSETLNELANTHFYAGNLAASDSLNRLVLAIDRELYGRRHPHVANALVNLGAAQFQRGAYREAEQLYRQALEIKLPYFGPDHFETAATLILLGQTLAFQKRYEEALEVLRPALAVRERVYGPEHPRVASVLNELGTVALGQGDLSTARSYYSRMVSIYRNAYDDRHYLIALALANLGGVYLTEEDYEQAEPLYREAIGRFTETLGENHVQTAIAQIKLGRILLRQGHHDEAEHHLLAGYESLSAQTVPSVSWLRTAREDLIAIYEATDRPTLAARFRAELETTAAQLSP